MTRAHVLAMVKQANALLARGDCAGAQQVLGQAWLALGEYSAALARQGVSPATALSLHKSISKALVAAGRRCGVPANMQGALGVSADEIVGRVETTLTTLGIAAMLFGIGYGFYTMYRHVGYVKRS